MLRDHAWSCKAAWLTVHEGCHPRPRRRDPVEQVSATGVGSTHDGGLTISLKRPKVEAPPGPPGGRVTGSDGCDDKVSQQLETTPDKPDLDHRARFKAATALRYETASTLQPDEKRCLGVVVLRWKVPDEKVVVGRRPDLVKASVRRKVTDVGHLSSVSKRITVGE